MSRTMHLHSTGVFEGGCRSLDTRQSTLPIPLCLSFFYVCLFVFCSRLNGSVRMTACVVWLSPPKAIQRRGCVTASVSIVKPEVETVQACMHRPPWMVVVTALVSAVPEGQRLPYRSPVSASVRYRHLSRLTVTFKCWTRLFGLSPPPTPTPTPNPGIMNSSVLYFPT